MRCKEYLLFLVLTLHILVMLNEVQSEKRKIIESLQLSERLCSLLCFWKDGLL